jgi:hypothetical protein
MNMPITEEHPMANDNTASVNDLSHAGHGDFGNTSSFEHRTIDLDDLHNTNNSGRGSHITPPQGVKGWSWGPFLMNWIWAIGNKSWVGLLCIVPIIGFAFSIYLGFKGREMAWKNKRWQSLEHFNRVQRLWTIWGVALLCVSLIGIAAAALFR